MDASPKSNIFITGASSRLGAAIIQRLEKHAKLYLLQHRSPLEKSLHQHTVVNGSLKDPLPLQDIDIILHLAGLTHTDNQENYFAVNAEGTRNLLEQCTQTVQHIIYISTRCVGKEGGGYSHSKEKAEEYIQQSSIPFTIIRPAEIYGSSPNEGIDKILHLAKKVGMVPDFLTRPPITYSPISMDECADFIATTCLRQPENQTITLCNNKSYTMKEIARALSTPLKKRVIPVPIPMNLMLFLNRLPIPLPFKKDQLTRLMMPKSSDLQLAREAGFTPLDFLEAIENNVVFSLKNNID